MGSKQKPSFKLITRAIAMDISLIKTKQNSAAVVFSNTKMSMAQFDLVVGCHEHGCYVWDLKQKTSVLLMDQQRSVIDCEFSPDGNQVAHVTNGGQVSLWDLSTRCRTDAFSPKAGTLWTIAFSPCGKFLASGSDRGCVQIWSLASRECVDALHEHLGDVNKVAFSPDGRIVASASDDTSVILWNVAGKKHTALQGHSKAVNFVAFSHDGAKLASTGMDNVVKVWDLSNYGCLATLNGHSGGVWAAAFSPDGQLLATGSVDCSVLLWDTVKNTCVAVLDGHTMSVWSVSFSPDGRALASGGGDKQVILWDVASRSRITVLPQPGVVACVAFRPLPLQWSRENHVRWPSTFRAAVWQLVRGHYSTVSVLSTLPMDLVELVIAQLAQQESSFGLL
jgi:WD40 repeat protein